MQVMDTHVLRLGLAIMALLLTSVAAAQDNPVLVGRVIKVTDGDTIKVQLQSGPINVRLDSIDTPESNQPHGDEAKAALAKLVAGREVELDVETQDRYERLVAVVRVNGLNVNERMVQDGHAWAFRRYIKKAAGRDYCAWEDAARKARRGLWALPPNDWIYPSDWRRWRRHQVETVPDFSHETMADCVAAIGKR